MLHTIPSSLLGIEIIVTFAILSTMTGAPLRTISESMNFPVKLVEADVNATGDSNGKTLESMSAARCGVEDNVGIDINGRLKRYVLWKYKWGMTDLTYNIKKYSKNLSHQKVDEIIASAFNVWSKYADLTFTENKSKEANIVIRFEEKKHGTCRPFDGPSGVLAHARSPFPLVPTTYVHFDDAEDWADEWKFFTVAIHEFGHSLGLGHTNVPHSVMQAGYPFDLDRKSLLSSDDIQEIQALYGHKERILFPYDSSELYTEIETQALFGHKERILFPYDSSELYIGIETELIS